MGYWALMWVALVAEEEFIFRRNKGYKCEDWNDPSKLPVGIAGLTAFIIGWVGPIARMDGADLGVFGVRQGPLHNGAEVRFDDPLWIRLNRFHSTDNLKDCKFSSSWSDITMSTLSATDRKLRIAIVGCGFLGTALLSGIIKSVTGTSHDLRFSVTASSDASLDRLRQTFASNHDHVQTITSDNVKAVVDSEVVMLGFQPYQLTAISSHKALLEALQGKLIVSLLAGVSAQQIREAIYPFSGTIPSNV
ncbi:hypothetical protein PV05_02606 [Exophiala xenobiotica]|uniref:Pyrroline-5-carboxylate reductase catalytic N-terminal domain-containing protein n=1 Tax=Exophiala xenobiotica TaxID=348802 RepID=A0A0D2C024_9EURO|nr:uncharacterized protein PV05_02606 [Exophiala xenobiotica]KIW58056.1 hypothetical protein PV05_02606 [Exophiala xenobiotica]